MNKLIKKFSASLLAVCLALICTVNYFSAILPETYYVCGGESFNIGQFLEIEPTSYIEATASYEGESIDGEIKLFGVIPVKPVKIKQAQAPHLIPGGTPIGIKILTQGVVVVRVQEGSPAEKAGIRKGDNIIIANGEKISSSTQLSQIISEAKETEIKITFIREGKKNSVSFKPQFSEQDSTYKAGIWIKDSSAGVGTLTFIDPETGVFGALGHPISDYETGKLLPLGSGEIVNAVITGCEKGESGVPGELFGSFASNVACGEITKNCEQGIFGTTTSKQSGEALPIAFRSEVKIGKATVLTTVEGTTPKAYEVEIERIIQSPSARSKNIIVKVTDPKLLEITGGIVQGMSGSPIIQDGKLVGAITHVFVSDPTRGYGIFIEDMLKEADSSYNLAA
ncbi:MAG: SpoIVB peptidase [Oscillospiraceae bacterium]|nr:SpoIVB peptidase [Oscillospiraceae bacterium]